MKEFASINENELDGALNALFLETYSRETDEGMARFFLEQDYKVSINSKKEAELLAVHSRRGGIVGRLRKAASERARCRLESWQALALGMSLQARTEFPQRETLLNREVPGMCHRGVAHGRDVTVGEHKPVALRPIRIFRIVFQYVKIERGENVRHSKRPRRMPAFGGREHFNNSLPDIVRVRFKRSHFGIR